MPTNLRSVLAGIDVTTVPLHRPDDRVVGDLGCTRRYEATAIEHVLDVVIVEGETNLS